MAAAIGVVCGHGGTEHGVFRHLESLCMVGWLAIVFDQIVPVILFVLMLCMGLTLKLADFKRLLVQPRAVVIGLSGQLLLLPALAWSLAVVLAPPAALAVGAMILAACPGGVTSNGYVFVSRGDVSLSVTLTAITSIVTVVTIPFITLFAMDHFLGSDATISTLPPDAMIRRLITVTIIPISIGMALTHRWPQYTSQFTELSRKLSLFFLIVIIIGITLSTLDTLKQHILSAAALAISLNVVSLIVGYWYARVTGLAELQARTISFEVGVQNIGLAVLVAASILRRPDLAVFALVYALFMKITALFLVYRWRGTNLALQPQP